MTFVCHVVHCNVLPRAIWYVSRKHWLGRQRGFVFGANSALAGIVRYICTYARPIHSLSCLSLHPINTLMCPMQISKGPFEEFRWNAYPCPPEVKTIINGQFISRGPEMSGNTKVILNRIWLSSKGQVIDSAVHQVTFYCSANDIQFSCGQLNVLDILC